MAFSEDMANHFVWRIANLSPLVERRLEAQDYRHHLLVDEDGADEQLFDLFQSLLHDLESIGITYGEPINELFQSDQVMENFLNLMEYIFPCKLYLMLRDDSVLRTGLYHTLDGSGSNGTLLNDWLDYISRYDPNMLGVVTYFKPQLVGNGLFNDYLKGLKAHLGEQHIQPIIDTDRLVAIDEFLTKLNHGINKLHNLIDENGLTYQMFTDVIDQISLLCRDPDFANKVGVWLRMRYNTLPKSYRPYYLKISKSILVSMPLSVDYYTARNQDPADLGKQHALGAVLLGWATGKYHPNRYANVFPDLTDWMNKVLEILQHDQ